MKTNHLIIAGLGFLLIGGLIVAKYPRGIRNNNPGNLRNFNIGWRGEVGEDEKGFLKFDTMQNGVRAMALDLTNDFYRKGLKSVHALISEFAPSSENNTTAYADHVADVLGVGAHDNLVDLRPYLFDMLKTMIKHENGREIADYDIARGMSDALEYRGLV